MIFAQAQHDAGYIVAAIIGLVGGLLPKLIEMMRKRAERMDKVEDALVAELRAQLADARAEIAVLRARVAALESDRRPDVQRGMESDQ